MKLAKFLTLTLFVVIYIYSIDAEKCSSAICRKCQNQFGNISCGLARLCSTRP
eukprot:06522.XXX_358783_358574_1 [CDS] Oithona nana genome sequencing.